MVTPKSAGNAPEVKNAFDIIQPDVVVAQDDDVARMLEKSMDAAIKCRKIVIQSEGDGLGQWQSLDDFMELSSNAEALDGLSVTRKDDDVILVLMTSGTTSLPKGCAHTNRSLVSCVTAFTSNACCDRSRSICAHLPSSHIFGLHSMLSFQSIGLPVVHASHYFEPGTTLRAIREEGCTDVVGVPAIVHALLSHPDFARTDTTRLEYVLLGGTTITPTHMKTAMKDLGVTKVASNWGMTECASSLCTSYDDCPTEPPENVNSGFVADGLSIRICDPDTGAIVPRGHAGELQISGPMVIKEYWASKDTGDSWNVDGDIKWLKTGDQAVMGEDSSVDIVGRYKDLIIRGGENISPKVIEDLLLEKFGLHVDVIGVPEKVSGEVPVAVVQAGSNEDIPRSDIQKAIVKELGHGYAVQDSISLNSLQLEDFPKTASGKVKKNVLRELVTKHYNESTATSTQISEPNPSDTTAVITSVWREMLGLDTLAPEDDVREWADSLIIARFPGALKRQTGLSINAQEVLTHNTAVSQAELLQSRDADGAQGPTLQILPERDGPPGVDDMVHTGGSSAIYDKTKQLCEDLLRPRGLGWQDVKDIVPLYSFQQRFLLRQRPQSNNHRHAFSCANTSVQKCRRVVEDVLSRHDMLRTMAFHLDDQTPLHVIMRPSARWNDISITDGGSVATASDLKRLLWNDPNLDFAAYPGPLFRVVLAHIEDQDCAGIVYMGQHSVFDAFTISMFLQDLDAVLEGSELGSLPDRVPFKAWVDSEYCLRESIGAQRSVQWHVDRLRDVHKKDICLFPPQRAPGWFKGNTTGWVDLSTGKPGPKRKALVSDGDGVTGFSRTFSLPALQCLKQERSIEASTVIKAALALVNMKRTRQCTALFAQYQAGRVWPYLQSWQASLLPSPMEVEGCTVQLVVSAVEQSSGQSVLEFLQTVQSDQEALTKFSHAPFGDIVAALNKDGKGDGDFMIDVSRRQIFNWLPDASSDRLKNLHKVQQVSRTDVGILWNCMQLKGSKVQVMPSWDDAQLHPDEVEDLLTDMLKFAERLSDNTNWAQAVGELMR